MHVVYKGEIICTVTAMVVAEVITIMRILLCRSPHNVALLTVRLHRCAIQREQYTKIYFMMYLTNNSNVFIELAANSLVWLDQVNIQLITHTNLVFFSTCSIATLSIKMWNLLSV